MKALGFGKASPYGPFGTTGRASPQEHETASPKVLYGLIVVLTFLLGVVTTLLLVRGDPAPQALPAAAAAAQAPPAPATLADLVEASLSGDTVTRGAGPDLLSPVHPMADVLSGLQPRVTPIVPQEANPTPEQIAVAAQAEEERKAQHALSLHMRMLREAVLAGVYDVEVRANGGIQQLMLRPVNLELSRNFMKDLLRAAEQRGDLVFPRGLTTADGEVDLDTMLFNLVQNALAADGTLEGAEAAREMTRRAVIASGASAPQLAEGRVYTVEPGDSLAYISLKFYGRPGAYERIFEANRDVLRSPDRIRIGQRLVIPG